MKAPKYIFRTPVAWRVKIKQGDWTKSKHFNFDKYGGIKLALYDAILWRDKHLEERGMLEYLGRVRSPGLSNKRRSPTYPCIGVYKADNRNWVTTVQIDKRSKKTSFSINKYGNKLAFLLACEARFVNNGLLIVINKKALPCKPEVPYVIKA